MADRAYQVTTVVTNFNDKFFIADTKRAKRMRKKAIAIQGL